MDDPIDKLWDLYEIYHEAKAELKDCRYNCHYDYSQDADYICKPQQQTCDELKDQIKATIKKIVDISKGE